MLLLASSWRELGAKDRGASTADVCIATVETNLANEVPFRERDLGVCCATIDSTELLESLRRSFRLGNLFPEYELKIGGFKRRRHAEATTVMWAGT